MASPLLTLAVTLAVLIMLETTHGYSESYNYDGGEYGSGHTGESSFDLGSHGEGYDDYEHGGHEEGDSHGSPAPAPGPPPKTRVLLLDLILTLDASSATGSSAFSKSQQFIIMLLKTYKLGGNSLRLKVVYSNGANIQIFNFENDAQTQSYVSQIQGCRYSGTTLNIQLIFQKITSFYLSFQRAGAGRCLFLMGGFNVGNSWEIKARIALYVQTISINVRFYYFAIGSQTSLTFWRDIMEQTYIIQLSSFSVTSSWTINWFQTNTANFKIYGLWRTMKSVNLQLVLTLDASSATGKDGYYKTFYMMLTLLRTHTLGSGNLQLYVCVHRGGQVNVVQFKSQSDINVNLNLLSTTYWSFTSVSVNVVLVLQKVQWVVQNSFSSNQPKSIWLCGGMEVSSQQRQVQLIVYQLEETMKTYFYYFAIGIQKSTTFWTQALGGSFVKTDFTVSVTTFNSILVNVAATASNLQGPTVTSIIMEVGRPTTTAPYISGGGSGHYDGESSSSHGSHSGGHYDGESADSHGEHGTGNWQGGSSSSSSGSSSTGTGNWQGSFGGLSGSTGSSMFGSGGVSSSTSTSTTNLSARIVNGITQIPQAFNVKGTGCAGMGGTTNVGGGYCAITNMEAFITWARSVGWTVERTNMNGVQTIKITGSVSYAGKK